MSEPTLTEEDREELLCDCATSLAEHCPIHSGDDSVWVDIPACEMAARVERIVARHRADAAAAALRPVQALADRWHRHHDTLNADGDAMLAGVFLAILQGREDAR